MTFYSWPPQYIHDFFYQDDENNHRFQRDLVEQMAELGDEVDGPEKEIHILPGECVVDVDPHPSRFETQPAVLDRPTNPV